MANSDARRSAAYKPSESFGAGTVVVERYVYTRPNGKHGVQWLSQVIQEDGSMRLYKVCKTRHEALVEADRRG